MNPKTLNGVRVWLSGSLPEEGKIGPDERAAILSFVGRFSESIFRCGGHIIHGSHPSLTPTLLARASAFQSNGGTKDCLTLCVSQFYSKGLDAAPLGEWRKHCNVIETQVASGTDARNESLAFLRSWMAARCDAVVVVGGKWWQQVEGRAGIPKEIDLAVERGVPCFLLGGLGGATNSYLVEHPEIFGRLKNGFDEVTNKELFALKDIANLDQTICRQLQRLPLVRGRGSDGSSFRILALDGGGVKGTFTASALATWEEHTHLRVVDHFDLVAGTSTGGILAIGLGLGLSGSQMLQFYKEKGEVIFPMTSLAKRLHHLLRWLFQPKFSQKILLNELERAYYRGKAPIPLKDSLCRLIIPSFHALAGSSHIFKTPHHSSFKSDALTPAANVALATASAPTYFSAAKVRNEIAESAYFDGGVWANAPVMAAIIEAVCVLGVPLDRIDVLSVGTTEEPFTVGKKTKAGVFKWGTKLLKLLMCAQEDSCIKQAALLAGSTRFLRVNVVTPPGSYSLDSPKEIEDLASLGNLKALDGEILGQVSSRFLNGIKVAPWERFE